MTPYKDPAARRLASRRSSRRYRERKRAEAKAGELGARTLEIPVADPVSTLVEWSRDVLRVPPGHPRAGDPLELPPFAVAFLRDAWGAHEAALSLGRKNGKTAIAAVVALGFLVGPIREPGWRGAVASLSRDKANLLRTQLEEIATASGLTGLHFRRSPYPGAVISGTGMLEILSADRASGHGSGYDLVICDETGLLPLRRRELLAGLRGSTAARNGSLLHISIRGDSKLFDEVLSNDANVVHVHEAPDGCRLDDESAWEAANPGIPAGIKSREFMAREVRRVRGAPLDEAHFRAHHLNQRLDPAREMIVAPSDFDGCLVDELPPRSGPCTIGVDLGESVSGSAWSAFWPEEGRLESRLAFGDVPDLRTRSYRDGQDYLAMERAGVLRTYPGRVVPAAAFLDDMVAELEGAEVVKVVSDAWKAAEVRDALDAGAVPWRWDFRRVGSGREGSADLRAFQRFTVQERLAVERGRALPLASAIASSEVRRDANGYPSLHKGRAAGRIDVMSSAVLAVGAGAPMAEADPGPLFVVLGG